MGDKLKGKKWADFRTGEREIFRDEVYIPLHYAENPQGELIVTDSRIVYNPHQIWNVISLKLDYSKFDFKHWEISLDQVEEASPTTVEHTWTDPFHIFSDKTIKLDCFVIKNKDGVYFKFAGDRDNFIRVINKQISAGKEPGRMVKRIKIL